MFSCLQTATTTIELTGTRVAEASRVLELFFFITNVYLQIDYAYGHHQQHAATPATTTRGRRAVKPYFFFLFLFIITFLTYLTVRLRTQQKDNHWDSKGDSSNNNCISNNSNGSSGGGRPGDKWGLDTIASGAIRYVFFFLYLYIYYTNEYLKLDYTYEWRRQARRAAGEADGYGLEKRRQVWFSRKFERETGSGVGGSEVQP